MHLEPSVLKDADRYSAEGFFLDFLLNLIVGLEKWTGIDVHIWARSCWAQRVPVFTVFGVLFSSQASAETHLHVPRQWRHPEQQEERSGVHQGICNRLGQGICPHICVGLLFSVSSCAFPTMAVSVWNQILCLTDLSSTRNNEQWMHGWSACNGTIKRTVECFMNVNSFRTMPVQINRPRLMICEPHCKVSDAFLDKWRRLVVRLEFFFSHEVVIYHDQRKSAPCCEHGVSVVWRASSETFQVSRFEYACTRFADDTSTSRTIRLFVKSAQNIDNFVLVSILVFIFFASLACKSGRFGACLQCICMFD